MDKNREQFQSLASATKKALDRATDTEQKAVGKLINVYATQGEAIRLSDLSASRWAWIAEHDADEEMALKESARENNKRAQPRRLNSYQRMLNIAKKVHESGKTADELKEEYSLTLDEGDTVTLKEFADWCVGETGRAPRNEPKSWRMYLSEAINKAYADGTDTMEIYAEVEHIIGESVAA